ncbi:hypothetical protein FRC19_004322 [Serendipita sp. 401]|nr:hypothetical protein FRC19_004322 [Serendipita sp. 401]KAG8830364.1 hypothetical protein FRC18_008205 [Serendipita sp. 400]KAG8830937.1 hypothetical protein FRC20_008252 [Serendipita sp. 405]KAG9023963.1 hypothetical protein FS842_005597 [Serendipita sp. 407]
MPRTHNPKTHLAQHVERKSRTQKAHKRGAHKGPKKGVAKAAEEVPHHKEVTVGGSNNGQTRLVPTAKAPRYYPAEDVKRPKKARKTIRPTKLKAGLEAGQILILLAGRFKGKRVVFLKQLPSGLLLVTGPYKVNGVPLKRVNQAYVIATSTRLELEGCELRDSINDSHFGKSKSSSTKSKEEEYFSGGKPTEREAYPDEKSKTQRDIDGKVVAAIKKEENMSKYLKSSWGLSKGQFPHALVF